MFDNTLTLSRFVVGCCCLGLLLIAISTLHTLGREAPGVDGSPVEIVVVLLPSETLEAAIDKAARETEPGVTWPPAAQIPVPPTFVEPLHRQLAAPALLPEANHESNESREWGNR